jgi:hypothetical protein
LLGSVENDAETYRLAYGLGYGCLPQKPSSTRPANSAGKVESARGRR